MEDFLQWLDEHWMFVAPPLTLTIVIYRFVLSPSPKTHDDSRIQELIVWGWLAMPLYAFHQLEEHGYDVYGRRYHFIEYFNESKPMGIEMTPRFITIINLLHVQTVFGLYAWVSQRTGNPLFAVLSHGLSAVNAAGAHIVPALLSSTYNPGTAQSLFMAPLSATVIYKYVNYNETENKGSGLKALVICLLFGSVWGHGISLLVPLKLASSGVFNEIGFALWAVVALAVYPAVTSRLLPSPGAKGNHGD